MLLVLILSFVCVSQGLSLNPESTELKILARLADSESLEFFCCTHPCWGHTCALPRLALTRGG